MRQSFGIWEDVSELISFHKGTRHGTAFRINRKEWNNIKELTNHEK